MITISIRWKVIFQVICGLAEHKWQEYTVLHYARDSPGKHCTRCDKSILSKVDWVQAQIDAPVDEDGTIHFETQPLPRKEEVQPWFKIKFSK